MVSDGRKNKRICRKKLVGWDSVTSYEVENEIGIESRLSNTQWKPDKKRNKECESMDIVV